MHDTATTRALFDLPEGLVYLDGNSLGPLPRAVPERVSAMLREEWGGMLIGGWNKVGWMDQPCRLGDRIGRLIGAGIGNTVVGDTLSIRLYQALAAARAMRPDRRVILTDSGNFPSDLYIARAVAEHAAADLRIVAPEDVAHALGPETAVLMLTEVDYRTGRRHDMVALTEAAHRAGALTLWDLAHSAGAVPVDLTAAGADFAVGCTYKYLNAGPGAPAFIYVAPELADKAHAALPGWLGHAAPFDFEPAYRPAEGVERMRIGTPPVIQMAALDAALDVFDGVEMKLLHDRSITLSEKLRLGIAEACPALILASPVDPRARGSQISFRHPQGYAIIQALIARNIIGDFRAPDILRFGIAPLYVTEACVDRTIEALSEIMAEDGWDRPEFHKRAAVT